MHDVRINVHNTGNLQAPISVRTNTHKCTYVRTWIYANLVTRSV